MSKGKVEDIDGEVKRDKRLREARISDKVTDNFSDFETSHRHKCFHRNAFRRKSDEVTQYFGVADSVCSFILKIPKRKSLSHYLSQVLDSECFPRVT